MWPPPGVDWYYADGSCALALGDCADVQPKLSGIDLVITDPPYGNVATHGNHLSSVSLRNGEPAGKALHFAGITLEACVELAKGWVALARRWVVFTCEWKYAHALDEAGLLVRLGIWRKPDGSPQFTGDRPGMGWEAVVICHRPGKKRWNGGGKHAFWTFPKGGAYGGHPTGKPLELFKSFLADFAEPGEVILDPFAGSGTTLRAAKDLGLKSIGVEREEKWCELIAKRLEQNVLEYPEEACPPSTAEPTTSLF